MASSRALIKREIASLIFLIRGQKVLLDSDLAELYGVDTGNLNRAVKRNWDRFPTDFCFQLSSKEFNNLKCQIGISRSWGGRRIAPFAFTEQGVAMLSSVLKSKQAALANVQIMRAFVKIREIVSLHSELAHRIDQLEYKLGKHDDDIVALFEAIKQLIQTPEPQKKHKLGF